jgi:hypothetical protein
MVACRIECGNASFGRAGFRGQPVAAIYNVDRFTKLNIGQMQFLASSFANPRSQQRYTEVAAHGHIPSIPGRICATIPRGANGMVSQRHPGLGDVDLGPHVSVTG